MTNRHRRRLRHRRHKQRASRSLLRRFGVVGLRYFVLTAQIVDRLIMAERRGLLPPEQDS